MLLILNISTDLITTDDSDQFKAIQLTHSVERILVDCYALPTINTIYVEPLLAIHLDSLDVLIHDKIQKALPYLSWMAKYGQTIYIGLNYGRSVVLEIGNRHGSY